MFAGCPSVCACVQADGISDPACRPLLVMLDVTSADYIAVRTPLAANRISRSHTV